jgi:hypothetical protein
MQSSIFGQSEYVEQPPNRVCDALIDASAQAFNASLSTENWIPRQCIYVDLIKRHVLQIQILVILLEVHSLVH